MQNPPSGGGGPIASNNNASGSGSSFSPGIIAGCVIGGVAVSVVCALGIVYLHRRNVARRTARMQQAILHRETGTQIVA